MKDLVKKAVERIYDHRDYQFYLEKCQRKIDFFDVENLSLLDENVVVSEASNQEMWPSKEWSFNFGEFKKNDFEASFNTILKVSKIASVFYIQHEFSVINKVDFKIEPTLDGYSGMSYTMAQYNLHENLSKVFKDNDYIELSYSDIYEVLPNLNFPDGVSIFGSQVTVEYALFHDLLDLCPEDDVIF
jgi:hypothetical protein